MNTEHFSRILKNYSQQLSLFLYVQFFRLIALTLLEPSTSLTDAHAAPINARDPPLYCLYHSLTALCVCCLTFHHKTVKHLAAASPLSLACCQKTLPSCRPLSYIRLIAHLETSTWHLIILLEHSFCHSYTRGYICSRMFCLFCHMGRFLP